MLNNYHMGIAKNSTLNPRYWRGNKGEANKKRVFRDAHKLFHISEQAGITIFNPRPSPSVYQAIKKDVVFAVSEILLHNYLLPRDCPRVTYYATEKTVDSDRRKFIENSTAKYVMIVESGWYRRIAETTLYCYEFPVESFQLLDDCAGYYISNNPVIPLAFTAVPDIIAALTGRGNIELRFTPSLTSIADAVIKSTLNYSLIRMRNAKSRLRPV